ncbi:uncharacterized protein TRUGW13939_07621 [Talaromyces rugulosus]|uniref:Uncharacterized protein n=1 Tax=Talaromyces rugulosus TaxID=121627 RepID=A0A7H8R2Y7_TALRU|nr:uncharacterized protein TRUGW13939_07621 [Talaromyces rugulosus]QKX60476.1 hypothetical protein TRUGW13939_07621 [Talaromyces rugulosus]
MHCLILALWASIGSPIAARVAHSLEMRPEIFEARNNVPSNTHFHRSADSPVSLRILPLGASITWGYQSSDGNGYRKPLRDQLRYAGYDVDMVGTKHNGAMVDNDVEAHIGGVISRVQAAAQGSVQYKPNVVLINAGTNDCLQNVDVANAGARMENLINMLLENIDGTAVVLSTLIPCKDAIGEANRPVVNSQYRDLVTSMQVEGKNVILADMDPLLDPGYLDTDTDYADDIHPNDTGYKKMAAVWWDILKQAIDDGMISNPVATPASTGNGNCDKMYGDGVYAGGLTQTGSGQDDGIYQHNSQPMGIILTVESDYDQNQWFFARLFDRSRDDFVGWYERNDGSQWYGVWRNTGDASNLYVKIADMNVVLPCIPEGVNFVDINADGLDDMVCIGPMGDAYVAINQGNGDSNNPPTFVDKGRIIKSGYSQSQVRLGDVDGDGRADYCIFDPNGDMYCWRNGWVNDTPAYWQDLGKRFTSRDVGNLTGVRLEDINGDGRDDWVWVGDTGEAYMESNSRSCQEGEAGDGLNIVWREGYWQGASSGPMALGMGVAQVRERIHFARVYGEAQAFGLLGRQDYVYLNHSKDGDKHMFDLHVWKNTGSGSTKLKADGDKYCNMAGYSNGMMDYVWTLSTGQMTLYTNRGMSSVVDGGPSFWDAAVDIFDPADFGFSALDRRDLHLTDWDGDGTCDIVWVDPDNQNRPQLFRNLYKETGVWNWEHNSNPAPELYCPESRGVAIHDLPVQFADISGNGRGDYLCIEKDGRTWGFVHNSDDSWSYIDQFKYSEQKDRADLRWADVNGDGKADLIWTDKFNGNGWVWYNNGRKDVQGSRYEWVAQGALYEGNHAGTCMHYPDLQGDKRADMHSLSGTFTNQAETWFNQCVGDHIGDDPGCCSDPELPPTPPLSIPSLPSDPPCQTVTLTSYPAAPDPSDLGTPIEGTSYFSIDGSCKGQSMPDDKPEFANKWEYLKQAYKDAIILADQSQDWPQYGTDASDLYFKKDVQNTIWANNITANIKNAANWDNPKWGFDNYIVGLIMNLATVTPICFTNNTYSWFWEISTITCCPPFFTMATINDVPNNPHNSDPNNLDLYWMQTSGSAFLHEMMHANAITRERDHKNKVIDETFTEGAVRIYGPKWCAKAARIEGADKTTRNPDSYAQFASAHYWQKRYGGKVPQPSSASNVEPLFLDEYTWESVDFYVRMVAQWTRSHAVPTTHVHVIVMRMDALLCRHHVVHPEHVDTEI